MPLELEGKLPDVMKILLIEDSEIDFLITEAQLRKALPQAFDLVWAKSYAEGLEALMGSPPDVALIDYFLHDENGIDLIRQARERGSRVPMILLTAKEDYDTDLEAMQAGADEFLVKRRLEPALLERMLRYVQRVHRQREEILTLNQELELRVNARTSELIGANYALQESERRMELLKEVASVSNAAATIEEAFLETLASISHYTGWPLGHVVFARESEGDEGNQLQSTGLWYNVEPTRYQSLIRLTNQIKVFGRESLLGQVLSSRAPIWVDFGSLDIKHLARPDVAMPPRLRDWALRSRFPRAHEAQRNHLQSLVAFPVIFGDEVLAAVEFFSHELEEASDSLLKLMQEIAQQLGFVVARKQAEEAVLSAERRLIQAQHIARLGSFVFSRRHQSLSCSQELQLMLRLPTELISLGDLLAMIHPDDRDRVSMAYRQAIGQHVAFRLDHRFVLADGSEIDVNVQCEAELGTGGEVRQIFGVVQDISERKRIEEVLVRMREAAEAANQAKSAFLASMSHEIRTPMNAILGFTQILLRDGEASASQRQHLTTILRSGEHLLGLINDILEVSKIESGRISLNPNPFDLDQLFRDLEAMFREKVAARRLQLSFTADPEVPRHLLTDEGKLRQVLINLLSNAVKFTDSGGIAVRVKLLGCEEGQALLYWEVEDTGCGIAADELDKVFASFEQTSSGIRSQSGTGLGMTISRSYVNLMGGALDLRSQPGVGTCFFFQLPVYLSDAETVGERTAPQRVLALAPAHASQPPRLLLVDDRETNLELLQHMLAPLGFLLSEAENGEQAVSAFEAWRPDAILMDAAMPVMDGLEATRRIRALPEGDRVVILSISASAFEHDRASILAAGATDFLAKPVREQDLLALLQKHLGLEYVYESKAPAAEAASQPSPDEGPGIDGIPAGLRGEMEEALLSGDLDRLGELAAELAAQDPAQAALADQIRDWAASFAYDQLNHLFQGVPA